MRKPLAGIALVVIAIGFYAYRQGEASRSIKREMCRLVDDLNLTPQQRDAARRMVEIHHKSVYGDALDISRARALKFDARLYQEELFRRMIDDARTAGDADLADGLAAQQHSLNLVVTEQ